MLSRSLVGSWDLFFREDRSESGELRVDPGLGANPTGLLIYDSTGHFSAQFMKRDRQLEEGAGGESTRSGLNNSRSVGGYDAYFGRYMVDDSAGIVTQTLEGAL